MPEMRFGNAGVAVIDTFEYLKRRASYALKSKSMNLTYEAYGAAKMARSLEAITHDEFMELNDMLVAKGMNNPAAGLK